MSGEGEDEARQRRDGEEHGEQLPPQQHLLQDGVVAYTEAAAPMAPAATAAAAVSPVAAIKRPLTAMMMSPPQPPQPQSLVYEVTAGRPAWSRLSRLAAEAVAQMTTRAVNRAIRTHGRAGPGCSGALAALRRYLWRELPAPTLREVLERCVARDRLRCHHNPTDCLALELWRVFYSDKLGPEVSVVHHEFAFPKTSNYPEIVQNLDRLLCLMSGGDDGFEEGMEELSEYDGCGSPQPQKKQESSLHAPTEAATPPQTTIMTNNNATTTSFKLELKQCEVGFFVEERLCSCLSRFTGLRVLEVPGLASDRLLHVIALYCTNLEVLNVKGAREQVRKKIFPPRFSYVIDDFVSPFHV